MIIVMQEMTRTTTTTAEREVTTITSSAKQEIERNVIPQYICRLHVLNLPIIIITMGDGDLVLSGGDCVGRGPATAKKVRN